MLYQLVVSGPSAASCMTEPPDPRYIDPQLKLAHCPMNEYGGYDHGTACEFECNSGFFMHFYNVKLGKMNRESAKPRYHCHNSKWRYTSYVQYTVTNYVPESLFGWGSKIKKDMHLQCLPKSEKIQDCNLMNLKKEISGSVKVKDCTRWPGNFYLTGTKCTLECLQHDYTLLVQNSQNRRVEGPTSVDFTCQNSTWVASTIYGQYKNKKCQKKQKKWPARYDCEENVVGVDFKNCPKNHRGAFSPDTKCDIECDGNHTLYAYGINSLLYYNSEALLEPISTKMKVTCQRRFGNWKWKSKWKVTFDNGTSLYMDSVFHAHGTYDKRFQCLPPSNASNDCPKGPPWGGDISFRENVAGGNLDINGRFYCPRNDREKYSEGTVCTWQCHKGNYLYNKILKTNKLPNKMSSFHYTCNNTKWFSSLSSTYRKGRLYCVQYE